METVTDFNFMGSKITEDSDCSHEIIMLYPWKKSHDKTRHLIKKQRHYSADKDHSYGISISHVWMWELDNKEGWVLKNWHFWTVVLENTFESPLDCREIKPINPKGNQFWIFIGRTEAEAEVPILASWCEELNHWKKSWCWVRLKAGGEGDDKGWNSWMASLTQWTWTWANSGR